MPSVAEDTCDEAGTGIVSGAHLTLACLRSRRLLSGSIHRFVYDVLIRIELKPLDAREIAARLGEAGDKPRRDRIIAGGEHDRNAGGRRFCCQHWCGAVRGNHIHLATDQVSYQRRKSIILALRPAVFDPHVLAFDIAGFQVRSRSGHHRRPNGEWDRRLATGAWPRPR
jgi:hypothetical protein